MVQLQHHREHGVWLYGASTGCGCTVRARGVVVRCEHGVWLYGASTGCGCMGCGCMVRARSVVLWCQGAPSLVLLVPHRYQWEGAIRRSSDITGESSAGSDR